MPAYNHRYCDGTRRVTETATSTEAFGVPGLVRAAQHNRLVLAVCFYFRLPHANGTGGQGCQRVPQATVHRLPHTDHTSHYSVDGRRGTVQGCAVYYLYSGMSSRDHTGCCSICRRGSHGGLDTPHSVCCAHSRGIQALYARGPVTQTRRSDLGCGYGRGMLVAHGYGYAPSTLGLGCSGSGYGCDCGHGHGRGSRSDPDARTLYWGSAGFGGSSSATPSTCSPSSRSSGSTACPGSIEGLGATVGAVVVSAGLSTVLGTAVSAAVLRGVGCASGGAPAGSSRSPPLARTLDLSSSIALSLSISRRAKSSPSGSSLPYPPR
ncbi:hypothetical protein DL89DRAFT_108630 [Linderina pennispora]|uniref:Uncharacterized protein n=1 Tax=Linderina pennispora TaxID=61395 RepID=A0A1Y1WF13_9FUNG|nr:uncharacterized protein DL89DRAFT_108630 [Linderina pennispora]ORX72131.1 hypothetical protein DL89DRAFT_108630 [Linderina pennispora]